MATPEFSPRIELEAPHLRHLRELGDGEVIHHFSSEGEEVITIRRINDPDSLAEYSYKLEFYGWTFAEADVYHTPELTSLDWVGVDDSLESYDEVAKMQAQRLLEGSIGYLQAAIKADFPESAAHQDEFGNPFPDQPV